MKNHSEFKIFDIGLIQPLTLKEVKNKVHLSSWDITGSTLKIDFTNKPTEIKHLYLIRASCTIALDLYLNSLKYKLCTDSAYYLLGLLAKNPTLRKTNKFYWGNYLVAADPFNKIKLKSGDTYLTLDFSTRYFRYITLTYTDDINFTQFLIVAEKI